MNKKIVGLGILGLMVAGQVALASFPDVDKDFPYYDAINYGQQKGIIAGYPDTSFKPDNKINRAEFVKIVIGANYKAADINACDTNSSGMHFSDTSDSEWYSKYLCMAKKYGIIGGYPDGSFKPTQNINFAEAAKIVSVAKNGRDAGSIPNDQHVDWYKRYVNFLDNSKAIPATIQNINYEITRGEMMEIIYRLNENISNKFSLSYDQVAGNEMGCVKAGWKANGTVSPAYQTHCCNGLVAYFAMRSQGQLLMGGGSLCMEPVSGLQGAVDIMNTANVCTNNQDLGQTLNQAPFRNQNFNGFSFPLESFKKGCWARCDVNLDTKEANIGWMCTGALK